MCEGRIRLETLKIASFTIIAAIAGWACGSGLAEAQAQTQTVTEAQATAARREAVEGLQALKTSGNVRTDNIDKSETDGALKRAVRRGLIERTVADPQSGTSTQAASQHQLSVVAEQGDVSGRARFYVPISDNHDFIVTFTGPLSGKSGTFATETGLGTNVSVNAAFKITLFSFKTPTAAPGAESVVAAVASTSAGGSPTVALEALRRAAVATSGLRVTTGAAAESAAKVLRAVSIGQPRLARVLSSPGVVNDPDRFWTAVAQDPTIVSTQWSGTITPSFEANRSAGDYLTDTYEEKTFDEDTQVFTLAGGVSLVSVVKPKKTTDETVTTPRFFAGGSFRAGNAIAIPPAQNVCLAASDKASRCVEAPVGTIGKADFLSATVEFRYWELNRSFGINPRYTFSKTTPDVPEAASVKIHTVEMPIYLMHKVSDVNNRDFDFGSDLVGGVNIGWRDSGPNKGAFVTVFMSKAFGLP